MRLMRLKEVVEVTGLSRSTLYKYIGEGRFPEPVRLGGRSVAWVQDEVENWILARIEERDRRPRKGAGTRNGPVGI